ncbi:MAG: XdhC/CoxI family protein [Tepidisphaeraceae bacterium]|jgi:xanthine dehydrogenase accessory factor
MNLLTEIVRRTELGEVVALCTVVGTRGSTPQDKGAAMVVLRNGNSMGTLGGGCVEAEVRIRAQQLMSENQSRLLSFRLDQDYGWDDGLVCGGTMDIAIQVFSSAESVVPIQRILADLAAKLPASLRIDVADESLHSAHFEVEIPPTPTLLIAGAGHVGRALALAAGQIDFEVVVVDDRADCLRPSDFPGARCILGDIESELSRYDIKPWTYVVIVTRGHRHDALALATVIRSPAAYVGLIGSKRKIHRILNELLQQGVPRDRLASVHAPIGLEIAAVTPAEIAVSIAAELIAVRRGRGDLPAHPMKVPSDKLDRWLQKAKPVQPPGASLDRHIGS